MNNGPENDQKNEIAAPEAAAEIDLNQGLNTGASPEAGLAEATAVAPNLYANNFAVQEASQENVDAPRAAGLKPTNPELGDQPLVAPGMSRIVSREDMDFSGSAVGALNSTVNTAPTGDTAETVLFRGPVSSAGTEAGQERFAAA
jgi:hypothetical protein